MCPPGTLFCLIPACVNLEEGEAAGPGSPRQLRPWRGYIGAVSLPSAGDTRSGHGSACAAPPSTPFARGELARPPYPGLRRAFPGV